MAKLSIKAGATSQSINIFVQDSSKTDGSGLTGLVYNTSGLSAYYTFAGAAATATAITLATLAAVNSAWSSGGFKEISSSNMPGVYRLDIPDAVIAASNGRSVIIMLKGASNMAPVLIEIELTVVDNQSSSYGLTNLDAAVSTRLASASYTAPLDAAGTRTAIGLASANLDTQIDAIPTAAENAAGLLDAAAGVETNRTVRQTLRLMLAALAGKLSGAATTTIAIRDTNDSKDRILATVDADGNRTDVTLDAS